MKKKELIVALSKLGIQLRVIDGNLKVNAPKGVLTKEILAEIKANKPYLLALLSSGESIPKATEKPCYPLTPTQYFMWFTHEYLDGGKAYTIAATLRLEGILDTAIIEKTFQKIVQKHESLRTVFKKDETGEIKQYILDAAEIAPTVQQAYHNFETTSLHQEIEKIHDIRFDLANGLPISAFLLTNGEKEHILILLVHHIVSDGWSMQLLSKEFIQGYNTLANGLEISSDTLPIQYKDYSEWLTKELATDKFEEKLNYWKTQFETFSPPLQLSHQKRPAIKTYHGNTYTYSFSSELTAKLKTYVHEEKLTLFMLLFGGLNGVFYKYTGETDITLGTTVAGREHKDLENQIGLYSNALAIRSRFSENITFSELIQQQKKRLLEAYENKEYPFTKLINELKIPKNTSRSPLFDIMVLLQNHRNLDINDEKELNGIQASEYKGIERQVSQQDLSFVFFEMEENLRVTVEYNTDIYTENFIERLLQHFENFISAGIAIPTKKIASITIISDEEQEHILHTFNSTTKPYTEVDFVLNQLQLQVASNPAQLALIDNEHSISYEEMELYSNQMANYFKKHPHLQNTICVGIELPREAWTIITILAILKVGGTYVPIDPAYPEARKKFIATDANCSLVITPEDVRKIKKELPTESSSFNVQRTPSSIAYIIYTSGSTGVPKGVPISYASMSDYVKTFATYFEVSANDTIVQQASISFDTSVEEIFPILTSGGTLIFHQDQTDFDTLFKLCEVHKVSILSTNPYVLNYFNKHQAKYNLANLRTLISGGDELNFNDIDQLYQTTNIYNTYGPTETTVCATYHRVTQVSDIIPIGKPISNRQVYILNPNGTDLMPIGIKGEIAIAGAGISSGYLHRPELTAEKFIEHPFQADQYLYRTGDIGFWLSDGTIVFSGRDDNQVKIRGYRIELGEIEKTIAQNQNISGVVVLPKIEQDEKILVAYLTGTTIDLVQLKHELSQKLPAYMIPQEFAVLTTFPMTVNGKIDKKKLGNSTTQKVKTSLYKAPNTVQESILVTLWVELLNVEKVGVEDNFFELGGHSLKAVRLINMLEDKGQQLSIKALFQNPTICGIIPFLENITHVQTISKAPEMELYPITASQRRIWTLCQFDGGNSAYNINSTLKVLGDFSVDLFKKAVENVVATYEILRTSFKLTSEGIKQQVVPLHEIQDVVTYYKTVENKHISQIIEEFTHYKFELTKASLLRINVIEVAKETHVILINMHHIISDGWSIEILFKEVVENYNLLKTNNVSQPKQVSFQFKDYAYFLENEKQTSLDVAKKYWETQLSGEIPIIDIPTANPRPEIKTYNGSQLSHTFSSEFISSIKKVVQENDATLFMGLMAAINALLYRYTEITDIAIGTPVAGRHHSAIENQIGLFLNTLVIRTRFESHDTFNDLIQKQKNVLIEAYANQEYPFDNLLEELNIKRNTSRSALFDIMVVLHNQHDIYTKREGFTGTQITPFDGYKNNSSQFDLSFAFVDANDQISVSVSYNTDIFQSNVIHKMLGYLENFLIEATKNPSHSIAKVNYLPKEEEQKLLRPTEQFLKGTTTETILETLFNQSQQTPNAIAIIHDEVSLTYKELQEKSNQFANYLIQEKNVTIGDFVGIKLKRSEWLIISILAVLKTGAVYVPIDIEYPANRIQYIEEDSNCICSITEENITTFLEKDSYKTTLSSIKISQEQTAYIIYTSGSTGKPKGVQISHGNLMAFIKWCQKEFKATPFETMYASTSHCFDLSIYELFYPLSIGKQLRILKNAMDIPNTIETDQNILINTVPSVIENLVARAIPLSQVVAINMAGEPIPIALSNKLVALPIELRNLYGPSEDTTYSSCYRIEKQHQKSLPIGKPIDGTQFYILSEEQSLQGEGLIGEIGISGKGLSKGYLHREELTSQKFIPNPFIKGEKMYLTGDLGYWLPDGNIGFIGRKDHQVKLRGYRIELEEIEFILQEHEAIHQAVVLIKEEAGEKYLIAYCTGKNIAITQVKNELSEKLPQYMVPTYFKILDEIPVTPNGKTDKKKLLEIEIQKTNSSNYKAPETDIEKELVVIWQHILNIEKVGVLDDFFEIGGHSLHITKMVYEINEKYDIQMAMKNIFIAKNIIDLGKIIEEELTLKKGFSTDTQAETSNEAEIWEI